MDLEPLTDALTSITPAQACQAYYILTSIALLSIEVLPKHMQKSLLEYGARLKDEPSSRQASLQESEQQQQQQNLLDWLLAFVMVPHSWFAHFYVLSVGCSMLWAWQFLSKGSILHIMARAQVNNQAGRAAGMDMGQVFLAWSLMALQGIRRLYESWFVMRPGSSKMSGPQWLLGLSFYVVMSVSVWIEGSAAMLQSWDVEPLLSKSPLLTTKIMMGTSIYVVGWVKQNECHTHLAGLKKYTLPQQGWFRYIVCPHYTSECLIYLGISIASAPAEQILNRTVILGLVFVAINLGMTAAGTKQWYAQKFGADKLATRWRMIPFIF